MNELTISGDQKDNQIATLTKETERLSQEYGLFKIEATEKQKKQAELEK